MKKFEYSITGNDIVPQNMIGAFLGGHPVYGGGGAYIRTTFDVSSDIFIVHVNYTVNEKKYKYTM